MLLKRRAARTERGSRVRDRVRKRERRMAQLTGRRARELLERKIKPDLLGGGEED